MTRSHTDQVATAAAEVHAELAAVTGPERRARTEALYEQARIELAALAPERAQLLTAVAAYEFPNGRPVDRHRPPTPTPTSRPRRRHSAHHAQPRQQRWGHAVVESKKQMKARGMKSPDRAEAILLAIYEPGPLKRGLIA
ncbi:hypothetical protein [Streptomyces sp. NPDC003483]